MNDMSATPVSEHVIRGRYKVTDLLGRGASGAVYLVKDERDQQKQFVLKEVLHAARGERRGFLSEASALKRLSHLALPRIHRVFDSDNHDRFDVLMDYIEGSSLEALQRSAPGRRFSLPRAMTLMSPIMDAVSYLHRQHPHLIHGDIKPSNIITLHAGAYTPALLVDLGGSKNMSADLGADAHQGTHNYRAPEQFSGKASRRSDVYALGAVFYTLLTGTVPDAAPHRLAQMAKDETDSLLPMVQVMPHIRPSVAEVVHCALSINRRDRFDTVEQFWAALWRVIYDDPFMLHMKDEEQEWLDDLSDASMSQGEFASLGADVNAAWKTAPAAAPGESPDSPAIPRGFPSPTGVSTQEGPSFPRRRRHLRPLTHSQVDNTPNRKRHTSRARLRRKKRIYRAALVILLVCLLGSGAAVTGYQTVQAQYQNGLALAGVGVKHLQTALSLLQTLSKNPFDASTVARTEQEFTAASASFTRLNIDLQSLPGAATSIPIYGSRLSAALRVVPLAMDISQAGLTGCKTLDVIISRFRNPFSSNQGNLTTTDLAEVGGDIHQLELDVNQATAQVNGLQPSDLQLDARVGKAVAAFHRFLPTLKSLLQTADQLLPALPALLGVGTRANYLVEILDSTQLRPGGGFIKDYGFATLLGGRLNEAHVANVSLLDSSFAATGHALSYPAAYRWFDLAQSWSLSDSNLDADFPTSAAYAERNYHLEGGQVALQGVIAITPELIERALSLTGPISIPELHETVTSVNLLDRLHYYELGPGYHGSGILTPNGHLTPSRYFSELLAGSFLDRVHHLPSGVFSGLLQLLVKSLHTKDLQVYFNASPAENILQQLSVNAQVLSPGGDSFFLVDANIAADTANQFITGSTNDQVTINSSGDVTHHTTIRYAWSKQGSVFGSPLYRDYVRVYVPPGSILQKQQGWQPRGASTQFNRQVWAGFFTLSAGQTNIITLIWTEKGGAKKNAAGWQYQYLVQRQAGAQWALNIQVTLPTCATNISTSGGLVSHGQRATLSQSLTQDTNLEVDYRC